MGGGYYDRDVGTSDTSTSNQVLVQSKIHSSCDPKRWAEEKLESDSKNPIVFALDVTGSMGEWTKIIYDKMPMFYGQIMMKKYLTDPSISFCAIGDHGGDQAPLQCTEFGRGNEIDQLISKIYLEGNGQGNGIEGYEMSAYFYDTRVTLVNCELPFMFITGDEGFYSSVPDSIVLYLIGVPSKEKSVKGKDMLKAAMLKYNLFLIKKDYSPDTRPQWADAIGRERILDLKTPKACIDIILGAIALTSGTRTLEEYSKDLVERGQSTERLSEVNEALSAYWEKLKKQEVTIVRKAKALSFDEVCERAQKNRVIQFGEKAEKRDKLLETLGSDFPKEFCCPITKRVLIDSVSTSDGETFERSAIQLYFDQGKVENPFTGQKLDEALTSNTVLQKIIEDFLAKHGGK